MHSRTAVITLNWNNQRDTVTCIESLKKSSAKCKLIVIDNNSLSEGTTVLEKIENITFIRNKDNYGFGRGINVGLHWALKHTKCEFLFIINNDATVDPETLSTLEQTMDKQTEAGIVSPRILLAEAPDKLWFGGGEVDWWRGGGNAPGILGDSNATIAMNERYISFASGCAMLIRRQVIERLGGFDERYFMYEEDVEFCLRAKQEGYRIWYEPLAVVYHVGGGSLRLEGEKFLGLMNPANPQLSFYVYNIVKNRMLTMHLHAKSLNRLKFIAGFSALLAKRIFQFITYPRLDGISAIVRGWLGYRKLLKNCKNWLM